MNTDDRPPTKVGHAEANGEVALSAHNISFRYGDHQALDDVSFDVRRGEFFCILGPNGGGKSTLFRLLTTLISPQAGRVQVLGLDAVQETGKVRSKVGVVFQSPSLDRKLTVIENMLGQASLFGIVGSAARERSMKLLQRFDMAERSADLAEQLSGGQRRRVEIAKSMLHGPKLLLMDEPSTGLDPGIRRDLAVMLSELQSDGLTIVMTTHLLDEAERADRLMILDRGKVVALDTPEALQSSVGGDVLTITCRDMQAVRARLADEFRMDATVTELGLRVEVTDGGETVPRLMSGLAEQITSITLGRPTLEDVFVSKTGRSFD